MNMPHTLPKRVVVIAGYARSLIHFRGPLLKAMGAEGHQVIAIAPQHDAMATESSDDIAAQLAELGVHFIPIRLARTGLNPREDAASLKELVELLRQLKPDVVFSYTIKPVIYGSLAARLAGVSKIYAMITGLGYAFMPSTGNPKRRLLNVLVQGLYRQSLKACDGVIFQNPDDQQQFIDLGLVPKAKTSVVNGSGLDLAQFVPFPLPAQPVFLLIARLLREKGLEEYVQAAGLVKAQRPEARFQILGPLDTSPGALTQADIERWEKLGVEYLGEVKDVRPVIEQASIYVLPSYREGTPRTVLEAMAMGRPVITTDAPGCRETVVHGQTGYLVPVGDVSVLAQRMLELADHPHLREAFGVAGVQLARSKYDVHQVNLKVLTLIGLHSGVSNHSSHARDALPLSTFLWRSFGKNFSDIIFSAVILLIISLPMLILASSIFFTMGKPIIFKQTRLGHNNRRFTIYKFRTMTDRRDKDGVLLPDNDRLTLLGRLMRSSSLDELPELFNILKGEMSLIGPRPLLVSYLERYTEEQKRRHHVKPGITGWAQINGRQNIVFSERISYDVWYVDNYSFLLDAKIFFSTIPKMIMAHGIQNGQDVREVDDLAVLPKLEENVHDPD